MGPLLSLFPTRNLRKRRANLIVLGVCILSAFVINHSAAYTVAALTSWAEFWLETLLLKRETKFQPLLFALGLLLVGLGQFMRGAGGSLSLQDYLRLLPLELITTFESTTLAYMCTCGSDVDLQVELQPRDHGAARDRTPAGDARRLQVHALTLCLAHMCTYAFINTCVCVLARYLRHPSYFGWFWWCVGTQCLLCNPLCILAYAVAAWDFFRKRIP